VPEVHDPEGSPHLRALQTMDDVLIEAGRCAGLHAVETAGDLDAAIAAGKDPAAVRAKLKELEGDPSKL